MAKGDLFRLKDKRLIKSLIEQNPTITVTEIAKKLGRDRTSVGHYMSRIGFKKVWVC